MTSTKQAPLLLSLLNMHYDNTKQAPLLLSLLNMHYDQHKTSISIIIIT